MRKFLSALVVGAAVCLGFAAISNSGPAALAAPPSAKPAPAKAAPGTAEQLPPQPGQLAGAPEPAEPHEEGVPMRFKADLALWSAITFVIFLFLLGRFAWRPLISALDKREMRIRDDIAAAEGARVKAEEMLAEHARTLSKVQDEVRALLGEGRREAENVKQEIVKEAQREAEAAKDRALGEIGRARDAALKDLFDVMASQVAHATEHVLGRTVTGADQDRLIDEALAEFPGARA